MSFSQFVKIKKIRRLNKSVRVYNFSVPKYETYVANGFVVHNCQNFTVSQTMEGKSKRFLPNELVQLCCDKKANGIAFTFNEPTIYYEYLMDLGCEDVDLPLVIKTNGFVTESILYDLSYVIRAFNVDIKGDEEEYQNVCGGSLQPVMECVNELYDLDSHVEISYLVTPRLINDKKHHEMMLSWLRDMPDIPVHFLYFYPFHKMTDASYGVHELIPWVERFREHLKYVYVSNVYKKEFLKYRNTYCPSCHSLMVRRDRNGVDLITSKCCGNYL